MSFASSFAGAAPPFRTSLPFSSVGCDGSRVSGTATVMGSSRIVENRNRYVEVALSLVHLDGRSASGVRYVGSSHETSVIAGSVSGAGATVVGATAREVWVSAGPSANAWFRFDFHVTTTPDGRVTVSIARVQGGCR